METVADSAAAEKWRWNRTFAELRGIAPTFRHVPESIGGQAASLGASPVVLSLVQTFGFAATENPPLFRLNLLICGVWRIA
jgi:hypothetical protein